MATTTSFLTANLAAHAARWGFAPALDGDASQVRVETAGQWPRISLTNADGAWVRAHSDRDPMREAARALATAREQASTSTSLVALIGAGAGYALDVIEKEWPRDTRVLLLEPEPLLARLALERRDWSAPIAAGRLMVLTGPAFEGRTNAWQIVDPNSGDPLVVIHPVIAPARPEASKIAAQIVGQAVGGARANEHARQQFAGRYLTNTLRNFEVIAGGRNAGALAGRYAGVPAVIAAAGPSLNRNLDALAAIDGWRDRAVVIAVDTALKPMLAAGLAPHFVVGVDPAELNARTLTNLPDVSATSLVAEPSLDPASFAAFADRTFLFNVSDTHHPWPWLKQAGIDVAQLRAWGSVLTSAYDFALTLGCNPIAFMGADLAYTNGQPYCRDVVYEEDWARATALGHPIEEVWSWLLPHARLVSTTDIHGAATQSSTTLTAFRDWLAAETARETSRRFVNATDGGILAGPRIEQASLASVLASAKPRASVDLATIPTLGERGELTAAIRSLLEAAIRPLPSPLPEWLDFAAGKTTAIDVLTTLVASSGHDEGRDPELAALVQSRAEARVAEGREWLEKGWPAEAEIEVPVAPPAAPFHGWHNGSAGDWCFGPTPSGTLPPGPLADFHSFRYSHLTARRLEHLATLGLPLRERHVLEVGAGVGDFTDFFLDRGCRAHATDLKPEFLEILRQRYDRHPLATIGGLNLDPPPAHSIGLYEIVVCYSVLTLVSDPEAALDFLAQASAELLLLETAVGDGGEDAMNPITVNTALAGAGVSTSAYRPSRAWIHAQLRRRFAHVYVPITQPNHYDYPVNWVLKSPLGRRAIFIASRRPLDNPLLVDTLPDRQQRH